MPHEHVVAGHGCEGAPVPSRVSPLAWFSQCATMAGGAGGPLRSPDGRWFLKPLPGGDPRSARELGFYSVRADATPGACLLCAACLSYNNTSWLADAPHGLHVRGQTHRLCRLCRQLP